MLTQKANLSLASQWQMTAANTLEQRAFPFHNARAEGRSDILSAKRASEKEMCGKGSLALAPHKFA
jgi:hypothetical protein